jgi:diguanylate cyclase (GGDEF)-like protein
MFYFLSKKKWLLTKDMLIKEVNKRTYILQIQNKRLKKIHQKLKEQSNIDPLTKIYNRKFYNEKISELLSSYKRYKQPFSYMIFDIDDFKKINDTYGHDIGDEVLKQLTKAISNHIRANDYFFRVGGEEFVILFSDTNLHQSLDVANKIKDLIFTDIDLIENRITISVGLTQIDETDSVETIYKRADSLLYEAKHNGKNQVKYN